MNDRVRAANSGSTSLRSPEPVPVSAHAGDDPGRVAAELTDLERELLLGLSSGWGSWMWDVGSGLCAKGLGTKKPGNIQFDTPLAKQVIAVLKSETPNGN